MAVGIALLGAGSLVLDEHLPAIDACAQLSLKAVYTHSQVFTERLTESAKKPADAYYDSPSTSGQSLEDLLRRKDIDAVVIALPIALQPNIIKRAIVAGKHVLSERPIAIDVETGKGLIKWYKERDGEGIWSVGESFRFFEPMAFGAEQVRKLRGEIVTFSVKMFDLIDEGEEHEVSEQGDCLLHGSIPFIAGLRSLLGAAGPEITHVAAFTSLLKQHLAPSDTIHATIQTNNGKSGTFSVSFGAEFQHPFEIQIVTDKGAVTVKPNGVIVTARDNKRGQTFAFKPCKGVEQEAAAFAQSIKNGKADKRGAPEQALMDLRVFQAMMDSGKEAGKVTRV